MKTTKVLIVLAISAVAVSCANHPRVAQGKVLKYSADTNTLVIMAEPPDNMEMTFSLKGAEVGRDPSPQDLVRIAYRLEGERIIATRVMNITKQKELKTGGGN